MWYIYTMEYYSVIKKNKIMPFAAARTDLEIIIPSEVKNKYHDIAYMWNFKNSTSELIYKTNRITDVENTLVVTKREW